VALFRLLQAVGSLFAAAGGAGILDGLFDRFPGFAGALLNPSNKFFLLAFGELEIVIRELGPLLFQLALGNVPVALNFEFIHNNSFCILFLFTDRVTAKVFSELVCWITVSRNPWPALRVLPIRYPSRRPTTFNALSNFR
jgi:hypothetical protein